ncbi:hypothetical protein C0033_01795 [Clostridium sp. chh4-2]|nr:hypothetical protein C0033_01795 [Clostridium sp. chh4-2]
MFFRPWVGLFIEACFLTGFLFYKNREVQQNLCVIGGPEGDGIGFLLVLLFYGKVACCKLCDGRWL